MDLSQKEEEIQNKLSQADMKVQRLKHEEALRRKYVLLLSKGVVDSWQHCHP